MQRAGARDRPVRVSPGALKAVPGAAVQIVSTAEGKMVCLALGAGCLIRRKRRAR
jgi:hypothetical protein